MSNQPLSLHIDTGELRVLINDDPNRVLVFNPSDVNFAERFYSLVGEFKKKLLDYKARAEVIDNVTAKDEDGLPINQSDRIAILKEACEYIKGRIDNLFGEGSSAVAFGDALTMDMFQQFFEGITPLIKNVRSNRVQKYTNARPKRAKR